MIRYVAAFVCLVAFLHEAHAQDAKLKFLTGKVSQFDGKSISLTSQRKKDLPFPLARETKVLIQTEEFLDIGKTRSPKNAIGKLADVKVGMNVTVAYAADNTVVEIVILRPKGK